jgi:superfamily II DNA/RNA helicase
VPDNSGAAAPCLSLKKDFILTSFIDLGLAEPILRALEKAQHSIPTPIQARTIPLVLAARDVIGIAQTGTGKTAAFALPILHRLAAAARPLQPRGCRVLVLSPTRELSAQIVESFTTYGCHLAPRLALAIGGAPLGGQVKALSAGVDVLVATPGRLLDLVQQRAVRLDGIEVLVLDEADRMLDMGFIRDIRRIVDLLPRARQTLLFSATMPPEIAGLARRMLRDPAEVAVTPAATTVERIAQRIIHVERARKPALLADILRHDGVECTLVFTRTKRGADKVVRALAKAGLPSQALHGNKSQRQRERVLAAFRSGEIRTLVATDIAARGIDVDGITHVVNFDLPNVPESYVHRIGRTARAGADGAAISFCDAEERALLRAIERLIGMSIPLAEPRAAAEPPGARAATPQVRPQARPVLQHRSAAHPPLARPGQSRAPQSLRRRRDAPRAHASQQRNGGQAEAAEGIAALGFMRPPRRRPGLAGAVQAR